MNKTTLLWQRMMTAARNAAMRHDWRAAARIRRDWTEWYYRRLARQAGLRSAPEDVELRIV